MADKIIAVAGGTGHLGSLLVEEFLTKKDVRLRLLVRPASRGKVADLETRGVEIVEGDVSDDNATQLLVEGAHAVVSILQGGPEIIIEGQKRLLHAARAAGARRFIPSDYSIDMFKVPKGAVVTVDMRRTFADMAEAARGDVEVVHVLNGGFLDRGVLFGFIDVINVETQTAHYWGDQSAPTAWTTYADTAHYTAAAAVDDAALPRAFTVAGDLRSFAELVADYEEVTGRTLKVERLGSFEDLDAKIADLMQSGPQENFIRYLPLMYQRAILKGYGQPGEVMNDRYPDIIPTTFKDYVQKEDL